MAQRLVIYLQNLNPDIGAPVGFAVELAGEIIDHGSAPLSALAKMQHNRSVVVIINAAEVLLAQVRVPSSNLAKIRQALPSLLEEQLSEDIDQLHFALAKREGDNCAVLVMNKARLRAYMALLQNAGIFARQLIPSSLALPFAEHHWGALIEGDSAQVRYQPYAAFLAPVASMGDYVTWAAPEEPTRLTLFAPADNTASAWHQLALEGVEVNLRSTPQAVVTLAANLPSAAYNLLQGDMLPKRRKNALWQNWLPTAVLLAILLVVYLVVNVISGYRLNQQNAQLYQEIQKTYRQVFPGSRMVALALLPKQIDSKLAALGGNSGTDPMALLAPALAVVSKSKLTLLGFEYHHNALELELKSDDMAALDQLKQQLLAQNLNAELAGASNRDGKVIGTVKVQ